MKFKQESLRGKLSNKNKIKEQGAASTERPKAEFLIIILRWGMAKCFNSRKDATEKASESGMKWFSDGAGKSSFSPWCQQQPTCTEFKSEQMAGEK